MYTIAVLFFKKSSRKSIISDFPYNTSRGGGTGEEGEAAASPDFRS